MTTRLLRRPLGHSLAIVSLLIPCASAQLVFLEGKIGAAPGDAFGAQVSSLADLDGDGVLEYGVVAALAQGGIGELNVYEGATGKLMFRSSTLATGASSAPIAAELTGAPPFEVLQTTASGIDIYGFAGGTLTLLNKVSPPAAASAAFGSNLTNLLDVDGDMLHDLVIGDPGATIGGIPGGAVFVYSGATLLASSSPAPLQVIANPNAAPTTIDLFGWDVAPANLTGPITGPYEFVVSSPGATVGAFSIAGTVWEFFALPFIALGPLTAAVPATNGFFGANLEVYADLDGDGLTEFLADEVSTVPGTTQLFTPAAFGPFVFAAFPGGITPDAAISNPARALALTGDMNGDGIFDFAMMNGANVTIWSYTAGALAPPTLLFTDPATPMAMAPVGDINNDGLADLLIGDPSYSHSPAMTQIGKADVLSAQTALPAGIGFTGSCAQGGMTLSLDAEQDNLTVNGQSGRGAGAISRVVNVPLGAPLTITLAPQTFPTPAGGELYAIAMVFPAPPPPGGYTCSAVVTTQLAFPLAGFPPLFPTTVLVDNLFFAVPPLLPPPAPGLPFSVTFPGTFTPTSFAMQAIALTNTPAFVQNSNAIFVSIP